MRCIYCHKRVFGGEGLTVPGVGPAHQKCFQLDAALRRTFQSLDISALNDMELTDLKDLVLAEVNDRERKKSGNDDIELF